MNIHPSINISPYLPPNPSQEQAPPAELTEPLESFDNPLISQGQQAPFSRAAQSALDISRQHLEDSPSAPLAEIPLSLEAAKALMQSLSNNKLIENLTPCDLLYTEILQYFHQLLGNINLCTTCIINSFNPAEKKKAGRLIKDILDHVHKLFQDLRDYAESCNAKQDNSIECLTMAKMNYQTITDCYEILQAVISMVDFKHVRDNAVNLKKCLDVIYYLLQDKNLILTYTTPLCKGVPLHTSSLISPLSLEHVTLYEATLKIALKSLNLFREIIQRDILDCLEKGLNIVEKLPQEYSKELKLALKGYTVAIMFIDGLQIKSAESTLQKASDNNSLSKLKSCLCKMSIEGFSSVTHFNELHEYAQDVRVDWKSFKEKWQKNQEIILKTIEERQNKLDLAISNLRKSFISRALKDDIKKIKEEVDKLFKVNFRLIYWTNYEAIFFGSMSLPLILSSHIGSHFLVWQPLQNKAINFHKILLSEHTTCSAFRALDLVLHSLLYGEHAHACKEPAPWMPQALFYLNGIFYKLLFHNAQNFLHNTSYIEHIIALTDHLCKALLPEFKEKNTKELNLKHILQNLDAYLKDVINIMLFIEKQGKPAHFLYQHFFATLFGPMSHQDNITLPDLLPIKRHMELLHLGEQYQQSIQQRQQHFQLKASTSLASEKVFWKINLKGVAACDLALEEFSKITKKSYSKLINCHTTQEAVTLLDEWLAEAKVSIKTLRSGLSQLISFATFCQKEGHLQIHDNIILYLEAISHITYMLMAFENLLTNHMLTSYARVDLIERKKKFKVKKNLHQELSALKENKPVRQFPQPIIINSLHTLGTYESQLDALERLKSKALKPLSEESSTAFAKRSMDRKNLINNCFYYLALIEEEKQWAHTTTCAALIDRSALHYSLLLESTEKISLLMSSIHTDKETKEHIMYVNNRLLLYSHNGTLLTDLIANLKKEWLKEPELAPLITYQERHLKSVFWFYKDDKKKLSNDSLKVTAACASVWGALATPKPKKLECQELEKEARSYKSLTRNFHKLKRNRQVKLVPIGAFKPQIETFSAVYTAFIKTVDCNEQCRLIVKEKIKALKRVLALSFALEKHTNYEKMPLFFATRASEIQVSLLSLTLQLALSTCKVDDHVTHPLFLDAQGREQKRSLTFSHRPKELWEALKAYLPVLRSHLDAEFVDEYIGLFNSDPRYPYPNKTSFSNDLIAMQKKVLLLQKVENNLFFSPEEDKLLNQLIRKEYTDAYRPDQKTLLLKSIQKDITHHQHKLALAFNLAHKVLNLTVK